MGREIKNATDIIDLIAGIKDDFKHKGIKEYIANGGDVNVRDTNGCTALHYLSVSVGEYTPEIIKLLLDAGADVNARDINGNTALYHASRHPILSFEHPSKIQIDIILQVVKVLLDAGADPKDQEPSLTLRSMQLKSYFESPMQEKEGKFQFHCGIKECENE